MSFLQKLFGRTRARATAIDSANQGRVHPASIRKMVVIYDEGAPTPTLDRSEFVMRVFASQNRTLFEELTRQDLWGQVGRGHGAFQIGARTDPKRIASMLSKEMDSGHSAFIQFLELSMTGVTGPTDVTLMTIFQSDAQSGKPALLFMNRAIEPIA